MGRTFTRRKQAFAFQSHVHLKEIQGEPKKQEQICLVYMDVRWCQMMNNVNITDGKYIVGVHIKKIQV